MDKETAQRIYVTKMIRFTCMQNELACMAIELGIEEDIYAETSRESHRDMKKSEDTALEAMKALQTGANIADLIKKVTSEGKN